MSSFARNETDDFVANELTRLFSPEFFVKKEDLEPFISILNGIKYEYWDKPLKFHHVIGLLHQLKLDTSTQVLEHQQLLIKNRLAHLLCDTPELLNTLLHVIEDASNNTRHVLNARPMSLGLKASKSQCSGVDNRNGGVTTRPSFLIRNNTVTLPWQPWFAHVVPKSSAVGRTIVQLHQRKYPYSFLAPRSPLSRFAAPFRFAAPSRKIVTSSGLMNVRAPVASSRGALNLSTKPITRHEEEFGYSRQIYKQVPPSLQHPISETTPQGTSPVQESNRQMLLKKQQEFLRQLDLLKADKTERPGCNKELFPPNGSSNAVPNNSGDNEGKEEQNMRTRSANPTLKMMTRQSFKSHVQKETMKRRKSPRNKIDTPPSSKKTKLTSKSKPAKVGEEKGLVLSKVSDHCIVISVPTQKSSTATIKAVSKTCKAERKQGKSTKEANSSSHDRAFDRVKKIHKKRHKAWMKMVAQQKEKMELGEMDHKDISESILDTKKNSIKISTKLFRNTFNKNNSCSSMGYHKTTTHDNYNCNFSRASSNMPSDAANISSLVSPSCYVSLKKMKLESNSDMKWTEPSKVQYEVDSSTSFPYNQELNMPLSVYPDSNDLGSSQASMMSKLGSSQDTMMSCSVSDLDHTYSADGENSQESVSYDYESASDYYTYTGEMPIHEGTDNNVEGLSYVTHANSFLKRLLVTPSPPKSIQKRKRVRRPRPPVIKIRKSKRQKRKRRQKEKKSKACSKEDEVVNVCT